MKTLFFSIALLLVSQLGFAQSAEDEKAVRAVIQKMEDAWNAHDFTYSGKYDIYDQEATMVNPVGMHWRSRAEIVKAHQVFGEMMFRHTSSKNQQVEVKFLGPTVALATVRVQYRVEQEHKFPNGQKAGAKGDTNQAMVNAVLSRKNEAWKIVSLQVTEVNPNVQASDPIKGQAKR